MPAPAVRMVDHILYTVPDVPAAVDELAQALGVRATMGGRHLGRGTRNALLALGPESYLEILGPDAEQPEPERPRWFGIDALTAPRLAAWAAKSSRLEELVELARRKGVDLGSVESGSRQRPDGVTLRWRLTDPDALVADGLVPFFIDWGDTPHPARTAAEGASLVQLRAEHPSPDRVEPLLRAVDVDLPVELGPRPGLVATIAGLAGRVELR